MDNNSAIIKVDDLRKTYASGSIEVHALRGISFALKAGEFVSIMGASGSGKSTFMNILGCFQWTVAGSDSS